MKHAMSVHLESFAFSSNPAIAALTENEKKDLDDGGMARQVDSLFELLSRHEQKITFFVVSMTDSWYPDLVDRIKAAGHEVGWHGHTHCRLDDPDVLKREIDLARPFLEKHNPDGFCPPEFSFSPQSYPVLRDAGFRYSTSCLGDFGSRVIDDVLEIPVSTYRWNSGGGDAAAQGGVSVKMLMKEIPYGSSFFIPLLGAGLTISLIKKAVPRPSNLFFHNWQVFDEGPVARRDRHWYLRRNPLYFPYLLNIRAKLTRLLAEVDFLPLAGLYPAASTADAGSLDDQ